MKKMSERAASTAAALLLQALFLLLLLQALNVAPAHKELARELTLFLPRLPSPLTAPPSRSAPQAPGIQSTVRPLVISPPSSSAIPLVPPSSLQGFGQALNDCAPQNYANLNEDEKAKCTRPGQGVAVQQAPDLMGVPSQVKDPARWANALAHEQSAPWLPCTMAIHTYFGSGPAFDPICLAKAFADGTMSDPMTWPTYETKRLQPEDFFTIEQAYNDWHAVHAKTPAK